MVSTTPQATLARGAPNDASTERHAAYRPDAKGSLFWPFDSLATIAGMSPDF